MDNHLLATQLAVGGLALWLAWRLRGRVLQTASRAAAWWAGSVACFGVALAASAVAEAGIGSPQVGQAALRLAGTAWCVAAFGTVQAAARLAFRGGPLQVCLWAARALLAVAVIRTWSSGLMINALAAQGLALLFLLGVEARLLPQGGASHARWIMPGVAVVFAAVAVPALELAYAAPHALQQGLLATALVLFYRGGWAFRDA